MYITGGFLAVIITWDGLCASSVVGPSAVSVYGSSTVHHIAKCVAVCVSGVFMPQY